MLIDVLTGMAAAAALTTLLLGFAGITRWLHELDERLREVEYQNRRLRDWLKHGVEPLEFFRKPGAGRRSEE